MTNVQPNAKSQCPKTNAQTSKKYDLIERTTIFSQAIINFCKKIPQNSITSPLINQLVRSGTSIGANYCEADEANSRKDFINKVAIAKKETKETRYWLQLTGQTVESSNVEAIKLWKEAHELNLILAAIIRSFNKNNKIN